MLTATALIAEDEPLLAQALQAELARAWPTLNVLRTVGDGASAVQAALELAPDVVFFDIRMPGQNGLEAAAELAARWPPAHAPQHPYPALVFVTAYDDYAVQAFEAQAQDYLLKPVQPARLQKMVAKLQKTLAASAQAAINLVAPSAPLHLLQASLGSRIYLVPIDEVLYFDAADKYLRACTAEREYLLRTPLKDLLPQLDPAVFWQIHRSTVVRAKAIASVERDAAGRLRLHLHQRPEQLPVSRLYAQRFRAM